MKRILIVEDDLATFYALQKLFVREGWQVSQSRTVVSALGQLNPAPDWIILDLGLADGEGEEVLRHVRETGIQSRVAVVSGMLDTARVEVLRPLFPDLLLEKPVKFEVLLEACNDDFASPQAGI